MNDDPEYMNCSWCGEARIMLTAGTDLCRDCEKEYRLERELEIEAHNKAEEEHNRAEELQRRLQTPPQSVEEAEALLAELEERGT